MNRKKIMYLVMSGLAAALICLTTAYILHIPMPNGYIHIGDAVIYLSACLLPMPYGIAAAGIGGALADLISGYPMYILPTFIIKSLLALVFYAMGKHEKMFCAKTITASVISAVITVVGYYFTAVILYGNFAAQIVNTVPGNAVQGIASGAIFCAIAIAIDKAPVKKLH